MPAFLTLLMLFLGFVPLHAQQTWTFQENKDDFSDADASFVFVDSVEDGARLAVGCGVDGGLYILYAMGGRMAGNLNNRIGVRYRFDQKGASEQRWWELRQNGTMALMPLALPRFFLGEAFLAETLGLSVRFEAVDPADSEVRRHQFSMAGLDYQSRRLACRN